MTRISTIMRWIMPVAGIMLAFFLNSATAASKAAEWLIKEQIAEGCGTGTTGRFAPEAVIEQDLTGDGRSDLIISHDGLKCAGGDSERSSMCGFRACSVFLYVREGDLLVEKLEILSIGVSLEAGNPPLIHLISHDFKEYTQRWNGNAFE